MNEWATHCAGLKKTILRKPSMLYLFSTVVSMAAVWSVIAFYATIGMAAETATWKIGDPIVTYWAGPGYDTNVKLTDAAAKQIVDVGMNLVWVGSDEELETARKHGLRVMYVNRSILQPESLEDPARRAQLDALIERVSKNPAMYTYHLVDEPDATRFPALAKLVDYLRQRDPAHFAYIDLLPNYASDDNYQTKGYDAYLETYLHTVHPSFLSYDHYQFRTDSDSSGYLQNLGQMSAKAKSIGVPFMNIVQAASWDRGGVRIPTADQERFLAYTTMAYGAQAICYYVWCWPEHHGGIVNPDGTPSAVYDVIKKTNHEFVAVVKQYQPLKWIGAYLKGYRADALPPGTVQLPNDSPFDVAAVSNEASYQNGAPLQGVLFGLFGMNDKTPSDATCALVVNLDYSAAKKYKVTATQNLSIFNADTRLWTATNQREVMLDLPPGGGTLVGISTAVSVP
jgi:hypothetical protein